MPAIVGIRVLFVLGLVNATVLLVMLLSCRCVIGATPLVKITRSAAYKKFARLHCWLWWPLWASVATHAVLAFLFIGFPV